MTRETNEKEWCTIESDPAVFTELIQKFGAKNVEVEEYYDLESVGASGKIYGLIFLYSVENKPIKKSEKIQIEFNKNIFFAKQIISNACATHAILSILLNVDHLNIGHNLNEFKEKSKPLGYIERGVEIGNASFLREAHNSFSCPQSFTIKSVNAGDVNNDECHYVTYIPFDNKLYELDGLKEGPRALDKIINMSKWENLAIKYIRQKFEENQDIRFCLLGIIPEKRFLINNHIKQRIIELSTAMYLTNTMSIQNKHTICESELLDELKGLKKELDEEKRKQQIMHIENMRRKHNYVPFIVNLTKILYENKCLDKAVKRAKRKIK